MQEGLTVFMDRYTKDQIALAPNNASAWNYLRGILERTGTSFSNLRSFVEPYTKTHEDRLGDEEILDLENPAPSAEAELPCVAALEFLADIYEKDAVSKSVEVSNFFFVRILLLLRMISV